MPSRKVLAERIKGNERLRVQQERWERQQRVEDRADRVVKDQNLNNVRTQLLTQTGSFATKEQLGSEIRGLEGRIDQLEKTLDAKIDAAFNRLNEGGSENFRETEAARNAREQVTKDILDTTQTNRRWLIALLVGVGLSIISSGIGAAALLVHLLAP